MAGFSHASGGSLEVGTGQNGVNFGGQVLDAARKIITDTFYEGYTNAMRVSLILPIAILALASLSCLLVKRRKRSDQAGTPAGAGAPERIGA